MTDPKPTTLLDKIWAAHEVAPGLLWIDLHLVHEVTSPQAFDGLRLAGAPARAGGGSPGAPCGVPSVGTLWSAVASDGTPTVALIKDELSRVQVQTLERNCEEFGVPVYSLRSEEHTSELQAH